MTYSDGPLNRQKYRPPPLNNGTSNLKQTVFLLLKMRLFSKLYLSHTFNISFNPHTLGHKSVISSAYESAPAYTPAMWHP